MSTRPSIETSPTEQDIYGSLQSGEGNRQIDNALRQAQGKNAPRRPGGLPLVVSGPA